MPDIQEAVKFLTKVTEADSENRRNAIEDLRFVGGDQWPVQMQNSRQLENRPCLTINKLASYIRQVTNGQRQQRPRIKIHPVNDISDPKIAEILTGIMRGIEEKSNADHAYDLGFDFAVKMGWGYWRLVSDYIRDDSMDQDIYIRAIENPLSVYFDPNSVLPDGSDAEACLITDMMTKTEFKRLYPDAQDSSGFRFFGSGDVMPDWLTKYDIRLAEYFKIEKIRDTLIQLSDGTTHWKEKLPPMEMLDQMHLSIIGDRLSMRKQVKWYKQTAFEILEERTLPGRYIPVVPVYGEVTVIDGKRQKSGLVRDAKDPQRMYNFWRTAMTEKMALAPKAKWLMAEGQDEGHENEFAQANVRSIASLRYKQTDVEGRPAPPPQYIEPEGPPAGAIELSMAFSSDLQATVGIFDPAMGIPSGPKSGKAIRAEQGQSENSNYHYYDNLTHSIKHTGRIILDWIPTYYDRKRVVRIIGDDGQPDMITVNDNTAINKIENDVTIGEYDVVMDTGPGFNTKREEAVDALMTLLQGNPQLMQIAGDLIFRNMDFPGAEVIADRLAAANPLAQIDDKSEVPPQAQMLIKHLQQQLQQITQQAQGLEQELKFKMGLKQMEESSETQREHMRLTVKAHDVNTRENVALHESQTKALTAQNVEELKGMVQLLLHHLSTQKLEQETTEL
ncbi:MAG: hypothetical protein KGI54_14150 [Pseudomonadota bacterium]|nr:hypothetical protein [Pseudomonadota bacterium]